MRKAFGPSAVLASIIWLESILPAAAQQLPDALSAAPEFWSTRYQRFYETLHGPMFVAVNPERPPGNLLAPPDIIVDEPGEATLEQPTVEVDSAPERGTTTGAAPRR